MACYTNESGTIVSTFPLCLGKLALDVYKYFNSEVFDRTLKLPDCFSDTIEILNKAHNQSYTNEFYQVTLIKRKLKKDNEVLVACSGGLDSVYQTINLKQLGYKVTLFHVNNMNYYSNGKEFKTIEKISEKLDLPLVTVSFKANTKKDNPYRKFWAENSFKDMLFYSIMLDYCDYNNIYNISSGDDLSLDISKAVVGTNLSDAKQVTETFIKQLHNYRDFRFIPTSQEHKGKRLKTLIENGLINDFYSCVNPGRFNQSNHKRISERFGIELYKYNCGLCRKCAFHNLLRHYYLGEEFTSKFIEYCWKKIANGADKIFFDPKLPLKTRIKNLYEY